MDRSYFTIDLKSVMSSLLKQTKPKINKKVTKTKLCPSEHKLSHCHQFCLSRCTSRFDPSSDTP